MFGPTSASVDFASPDTQLWFVVDRHGGLVFFEPTGEVWSELLEHASTAGSDSASQPGRRGARDPHRRPQVRAGDYPPTGQRPSVARPGQNDVDHLEFLPGKTSVPVLIDHDPARVRSVKAHAGRLDRRMVDLSASHDQRPTVMAGARNPVSFGHQPVGTTDFNGCEIRRRGYVTEISVLSSPKKPAEPLAEVLTLRRTATPATADRTHDAHDLFHQPHETVMGGGLLVRPAIGQVLGVR